MFEFSQLLIGVFDLRFARVSATFALLGRPAWEMGPANLTQRFRP
jgi:hypothetical protein